MRFKIEEEYYIIIRMLGAIIGDMVGSRWEFNPTNNYNFEWLSDKNGFTDDTICTVAVADAILHNSEDFGKYIHEWCRKYPHPMGGYGGRFAQWVRSDNPQPYNSFGNGSAMRVSPVAYCYEDECQMLKAAEATAVCSHNHLEGIKGAKTVAMAIYTAQELHQGREHRCLSCLQPGLCGICPPGQPGRGDGAHGRGAL